MVKQKQNEILEKLIERESLNMIISQALEEKRYELQKLEFDLDLRQLAINKKESFLRTLESKLYMQKQFIADKINKLNAKKIQKEN